MLGSLPEREQTKGIEILLSNTTSVGSDVCYTEARAAPLSGAMTMTCSGPAQSIFIRKRTEPKVLNFCEIEIYGKHQNCKSASM